MMHRRKFLRTILAGGVVIGAGSLMSGCKGIARNDLQPRGASLESIPGLDETDTTILYHASLAPSGHNAQPWYVKVLEPKKWIVGIDPRRRLPAVDPANRETLLSIAAGAVGFQTQTEVIAADPMEEEIVKVSLKKVNKASTRSGASSSGGPSGGIPII
jgi:hypothetical protein